MAWSLAAVWGAGTSLLLVSAAVPDPSVSGEPGLLTTAAVAYAIAAAIWVTADRLPSWGFDILVSAALILISTLVYTAGASGPYAVFYLWPIIWAFSFLPTARAVAQLTVAVIADAAVLGVQSGTAEFPVARFLVIAGTLGIAAVLVATLTARVQRLLVQVDGLARTDTLTAIANRRGFDATLERELARARRSGAPLSVVLLDVDRFKALNDRHGHGAGDVVLAALGALLAAEARPADLPSRIGGEEFALLLPDTDAQQAWPVAERVREQVQSRVSDPDGKPVTVSLGIVSAPPYDAVAARLLHEADAALYAAKHAGRNRTVVAQGLHE